VSIIGNGLLYGGAITGYLLLCMLVFSPRVWGYMDYPDIVKKKVPAQTPREKRLALLTGLPWIAFLLAFPVWSTFALKAELGGRILFATAFLNVLVMFAAATFGDLILLDWLIISRITPKFVIIPGSAREDYRDFSHHFRGHAKAAALMVILALIIAGLASPI
jgi:hypothetical protein